MAEFAIGERVRFHHFAGKIADSCWMPSQIQSAPWEFLYEKPSGFLVRITHPADHAGREIAVDATELAHID